MDVTMDAVDSPMDGSLPEVVPETATAAAAAVATVATATTACYAAAQAVPNPPPTPLAWDAHLEVPATNVEPWLSSDIQIARRVRLGLDNARALEFAERSEFISLGCFCAITRSLQALGLKKYSYPFDWVRSPLDGIIHCLDTHFQDFMTYSSWRREGDYTVYGGTRWGGSFWHHDIEAPNTRSDFSRRIERLYGRGEVPACTPRMFIRSVNATREVQQAERLLEALRRANPDGPVRLLLVVDVQRVKGPLAIKGELGKHVLLYRIHESLYTNPQQGMPLQECSEAYAEAIAYAINYWSGGIGCCSTVDGQVVPSLQIPDSCEDISDAASRLEHWDGGNAAEQLFCPRRFRGQQLTFGGNKEFPGLLERCQVSNLWLPEGLLAGLANPRANGLFHTYAFGKTLGITLPKGAASGHMLQVCLSDGVLSATVYSLAAGLAHCIGEATVTTF